MNAFLDRMVETGQVPAVLLLTGAKDGVTISNAKSFAKKLMGASHAAKIDSGCHPDLHLYQIEGKSGTHTAVSMQQLIKEVFLPPFEAKIKIFIIDEAHRMLPASSNALLKTLEEPPKDCFIILLSCKPQLLLPTIVSRCRKVVMTSNASSLRTEWEEPLEKLFKAYNEKDYICLFKEAAHIEDLVLEEEPGSSEYFQKIEDLFEAIQMRLRPENSISKILNLLEKSQLALERSIKLRSILIYFLLSFER